MPRSARLQELGLPMHVIAQGIERCAIFRDDEDRRRFVDRAARVFAEMGVLVFAWALMDNHVHLVLRSIEADVGKAMQRVLGPHAQLFNRRHGRVGPLYRDRFWSRPTEDDDDLLGLICYVSLNPLRGGIVRDVAELSLHPWASLAELLSPPRRRASLVDRTETLSLFGPDVASALDGLLGMLRGIHARDPDGDEFARDEPGGRAALARREREDLRAASVHALRLDSARIDAVLRREESRTALRLRLERRGWTLERAVARAAELCGVSERALRHGRRRRRQSRARSMVAHFAHVYLGCPDAEIARATGVGSQCVPRIRQRFSEASLPDAIGWCAFFGLDDECDGPSAGPGAGRGADPDVGRSDG